MTDTPTADPTPNPAESVESPAGPARIEPLSPSHGGWAAVTLLFFWPLSFSAFSHAFTVVLSIVLTAVVEGRDGYDESSHHGVEQGPSVDDH
jgi:hypothetical protein